MSLNQQLAGLNTIVNFLHQKKNKHFIKFVKKKYICLPGHCHDECIQHPPPYITHICNPNVVSRGHD